MKKWVAVGTILLFLCVAILPMMTSTEASKETSSGIPASTMIEPAFEFAGNIHLEGHGQEYPEWLLYIDVRNIGQPTDYICVSGNAQRYLFS